MSTSATISNFIELHSLSPREFARRCNIPVAAVIAALNGKPLSLADRLAIQSGTFGLLRADDLKEPDELEHAQ